MRAPYARDELGNMLNRRLRQNSVAEICYEGNLLRCSEQSINFPGHHGATCQEQNRIEVSLQGRISCERSISAPPSGQLRSARRDDTPRRLRSGSEDLKNLPGPDSPRVSPHADLKNLDLPPYRLRASMVRRRNPGGPSRLQADCPPTVTPHRLAQAFVPTLHDPSAVHPAKMFAQDAAPSRHQIGSSCPARKARAGCRRTGSRHPRRTAAPVAASLPQRPAASCTVSRRTPPLLALRDTPGDIFQPAASARPVGATAGNRSEPRTAFLFALLPNQIDSLR